MSYLEVRSAAFLWFRFLIALSLIVGTTPVGATAAHVVAGCSAEVSRFGKDPADCGCKIQAAGFAKAKPAKAPPSRSKAKTFLAFAPSGGFWLEASTPDRRAVGPRDGLKTGISHLAYFGRSPPVRV